MHLLIKKGKIISDNEFEKEFELVNELNKNEILYYKNALTEATKRFFNSLELTSSLLIDDDIHIYGEYFASLNKNISRLSLENAQIDVIIIPPAVVKMNDKNKKLNVIESLHAITSGYKKIGNIEKNLNKYQIKYLKSIRNGKSIDEFITKSINDFKLKFGFKNNKRYTIAIDRRINLNKINKSNIGTFYKNCGDINDILYIVPVPEPNKLLGKTYPNITNDHKLFPEFRFKSTDWLLPTHENLQAIKMRDGLNGFMFGMSFQIINNSSIKCYWYVIKILFLFLLLFFCCCVILFMK